MNSEQTNDFKTKYRPTTLPMFWGNEHVKKIWGGFQKKNNFPHAVMLHGNYGVGKSSLGKILGEDILRRSANQWSLLDGFHAIDSTKYDSESIRRLISSFAGFSHGPSVLFFDEFHRLPIKAQEILLMPMEETGGENLFFIFATSDIKNIEGGILSRSHKFKIVNPPRDILVAELSKIAEAEEIKISREALDCLAELSNFTPRDCLINLESLLCFEGLVGPRDVEDLLNPT